MKEKKKKRRSLARRLTRRVMWVLALTNIIIISVVLLFVFAVTYSQNIDYYQATIQFVGEKFRNVLTNVEEAVADKVQEIEGHLNNPDQLYSDLEQELRLNRNVVGAFMAFEPNVFPQQGKWFEPYVIRCDSGTVERKQIGSADHNYFDREWYVKSLEASDGYWSNPYYDADGAQALLCSYIMPIHDSQGRAVGVFGVDLPLAWIEEQVRQIMMKENENALIDPKKDEHQIFCFIIGRNGEYVVAPDSAHAKEGSFLDDVKKTPNKRDDRVCNDMLAGKKDHSLMDYQDVNYFVCYSPLGLAEWSMAIGVPWMIMNVWGIGLAFFIICIMLIGGIIIFFICHYNIRRITKPLRFLADSADEVAKGHFDTPLPNIKHNDEIMQLRDSFGTMQQALAEYVEELQQTTASKASIESELRIAQNIQMSMLPKTFPAFPERTDIDIYGDVMPAKAVGGDLYDFFIRDEKLFFCIGDVAGKGIPASLVMAVTRSLFRNIAAHTARPNHIMMALNEALCEGNDASMFVTLFVGVLDLPTGRLRYSNAGHDAPYLLNEESEELRMKNEEFATAMPSPEGTPEGTSLFTLHSSLLPVDANLPVGAMSGISYSCQEIMIDPDTTIFLYTDGLTEAEDADHQLFGRERVRHVAQTAPANPQQLISVMKEAVSKHVNGMEQSDDLTMLAVQYTRKHLKVRLKRNLTLHNDIQEVPELSAFVEEVCEAIGFDASMTMKMDLAIEEAVVNVMNYAYPKGQVGEVRIGMEANDERLKVIISDDGVPFDPTDQDDVDTTLPLEERGVGGLGIHLVRNLMDSINYERTNGQNIFTLRKKL